MTKSSWRRLSQSCRYFYTLGKETHVRAIILRANVGDVGAIHALVYDRQYRSFCHPELLKVLLGRGAILSRAAVQTVAQSVQRSVQSLPMYGADQRSNLPYHRHPSDYHPLFIAQVIIVGYEKYGDTLNLDKDDHAEFAPALHCSVPHTPLSTTLFPDRYSSCFSRNPLPRSSLDLYLDQYSYCPNTHLELSLLHHQTKHSANYDYAVAHFYAERPLIKNLIIYCTSPEEGHFKLILRLVANGFDLQTFISSINDRVMEKVIDLEKDLSDITYLFERGFHFSQYLHSRTSSYNLLKTLLEMFPSSTQISNINFIRSRLPPRILKTTLIRFLHALINSSFSDKEDNIRIILNNLQSNFPVITDNVLGVEIFQWMHERRHEGFPFRFWGYIQDRFPIDSAVNGRCFELWVRTAFLYFWRDLRDGQTQSYERFERLIGKMGPEIYLQALDQAIEGALRSGIRVRPGLLDMFPYRLNLPGWTTLFEVLIEAVKAQCGDGWNDELNGWVGDCFEQLKGLEAGWTHTVTWEKRTCVARRTKEVDGCVSTSSQEAGGNGGRLMSVSAELCRKLKEALSKSIFALEVCKKIEAIRRDA
ncbi:hypothetical protein HDV00_002609 [Rhizophlyctis rosea]|nr:hypothetical protein HDV00_002609 [Rhizophlyctis rosea]